MKMGSNQQSRWMILGILVLLVLFWGLSKAKPLNP
jgi:hypothetical protein